MTKRLLNARYFTLRFTLKRDSKSKLKETVCLIGCLRTTPRLCLSFSAAVSDGINDVCTLTARPGGGHLCVR